VAALTAALAISLIGGSAWLWVQNQRLNVALKASETAHEATVAANRALNARMDFLLGGFADELEDIGKNKLVSETWEKLDAEQTSDPYLQKTPGMAWRRSGVLARWAQTLLLQGKGEAALEKAELGLKLCSPADAGDLTREDQAMALSKLHLVRAKALSLLGQFGPAEDAFVSANSELERFGTTRCLKALAENLVQEGIMWGEISSDSDFGTQAKQAAEKALRIATDQVAAGQDPAYWSWIVLKCRIRLASADYHAKGLIQSPNKPLDDADLIPAREIEKELAAILVEVEVREKMMPREKDALDYRRTRRQLEFRLAQTQCRIPEKQTDGKARLSSCIEQLLQEVAADPMSHYWRVPYAEALGEWAGLHALGDEQQAIDLRRKAVAACDEIRKSGRTGRREILVTANNHLSLARLLLNSGEVAEAVSHYRQTITTVKPLLALNGGNLVDQEGWVNLIDKIGRELGRGNQVAAAKQIATEAIAFNEANTKAADGAVWNWGLGKFYRDLGDITNSEGKLDEALDATVKALKIRSELLQNGKFIEKTNGDTANAYESLARLHFKRRDVAMAADTIRQALLLRQQLPRTLGEGYKWGKMVLLLEKERPNFPEFSQNEITELARLGLRVLYSEGSHPKNPKDRECFDKLTLLAGQSAPK
jgi:tetratricopeptide (TPR) repeat protein